MSKLAVIHLSDIHIKLESDISIRETDAISKACFQAARDAEVCLIAITGDIAFSGLKSQYDVAVKNLINPIIEILKKETGRAVYISIAPGNHDCRLIPSNSVRETIIESIVSEPSKAEDESIVECCTTAQNDFFEFLHLSLSPNITIRSKLFWQQEFVIGDKNVLVSSLNAAWMSRLPEEQGQLVYPIDSFEGLLEKPAHLHLALLHHPFKWYNQSSYHQLRKRLRCSCTAILSGHEHLSNFGKIEEQTTGSSLFFEGAALHPHEVKSEAGFSIHLFDICEKKVYTQAYSLNSAKVRGNGDVVIQSWSNEGLIHGALDVRSQFSTTLNDIGGNFTHSNKEKLTLEDIYIWPDIQTLVKNEISKQKIRSSKELLTELEQDSKLLIYGDEKSGKSTLLFWYFRELVSHGFAPVYLAGIEFNVKSENDTQKFVSKAIAEQYKNPTAVEGFPKLKRILIVDDIDRLKSGINSLPYLLAYGHRHFSGICLTASTEFEIANLTSQESSKILACYNKFNLIRFGLKLRHQLIKKWCSLSIIETKIELDKQVDEVESLINLVIGKRLVPEYPFYLLILLQSCEQHRYGEIQNSGLSFYYQYLITKSLGEVGVKPNELDEKGAKELDKTDLVDLNSNFSDRFISVDIDNRLGLLTKAHILSKKGNSYSFAYPYIYYFFIGRHLAKNLDNPEVREWVEESCKKLYLRDRAHSIMFLTHHTENRWVINLICQVLSECFSDKKPIELNVDTIFLSNLVKNSSSLTLLPQDIDKNQIKDREIRDTIAEHELENEANEYNSLTFISKWNLLHKTAEILWLILKNYYGSIEKTHKAEMIRHVFDGPLRALRLLTDELSTDMSTLISELKQQEEGLHHKKITSEELDRNIKRRIFNLMGLVATLSIASSGSFVASEKLREDVSNVVGNNPTNAYRLIEASTLLLKPGLINMDKVKKLAEDIRDNAYAFGVLQSLGYYHMYMFHTSEPQKQALSQVLDISFGVAKSIDLKNHGRTLKK